MLFNIASGSFLEDSNPANNCFFAFSNSSCLKSALITISLKISNKAGFLSLFSTHPPLEQRIRALKQNTQIL
jgi:Zn-dependent protease with chaperone function